MMHLAMAASGQMIHGAVEQGLEQIGVQVAGDGATIVTLPQRTAGCIPQVLQNAITIRDAVGMLISGVIHIAR